MKLSGEATLHAAVADGLRRADRPGRPGAHDPGLRAAGTGRRGLLPDCRSAPGSPRSRAPSPVTCGWPTRSRRTRSTLHASGAGAPGTVAVGVRACVLADAGPATHLLTYDADADDRRDDRRGRAADARRRRPADRGRVLRGGRPRAGRRACRRRCPGRAPCRRPGPPRRGGVAARHRADRVHPPGGARPRLPAGSWPARWPARRSLLVGALSAALVAARACPAALIRGRLTQ